MGSKKRKNDDSSKASKSKISKKDAKKSTPQKRKASESDSEAEVTREDENANLPTPEVMNKMLDRIESFLPKDDHVKYDSRARKLDWNKVAFDDMDALTCQKTWSHIQERIRRFRIMAEMIPDARTWISQPWTNFYKSKDHNRHPDMPKKPLSMYMLFYSEMREEILKSNPHMSMPEVAKACSEKYQKLSEKKKSRYKNRCDDMRREYEKKMENFYAAHPELKPVKADKSKKAANSANAAAANIVNYSTNIAANNMAPPIPIATQQYVSIPQQHQVIATIAPPIGTAINTPIQLEVPQTYQTQEIQQPQQYIQPNQIQVKQETVNPFPNAPERPPKPFDLFFKSVVDEKMKDTNFDRQSTSERCRAEWKTMKLKKKAKWIRKASDKYREYEEQVANFIQQNPSYVPPDKKNFLTQEDQKILDKFMGRPVKPPSSAYSLFSKEMLNNAEIKQYPSKERMAQISGRWKTISQEQKDRYQAQVNDSMSIYRQKYEQWFNDLSEEERKAETARVNTSKSKGKVTAAKSKQTTAAAAANLQTQQPQTQQQQPVVPVTYTMNIPQQYVVQTQAATTQPKRDVNELTKEILAREPIEPPRSPKQLFITEWLSKHKKKKPEDAKEAWKNLEKKAKKQWVEKLEPKRQNYIEEYTVFVRGLNKEELELYTQMKNKRDEEEESRREAESSDSEVSDSSESDSDSDSESESE